MTQNKKARLKEAATRIISSELLAYRTRRGISQEKFARELDITTRAYLDLEHGRSICSLWTLVVFLTQCLTREEALILIAKFRKAFLEAA